MTSWLLRNDWRAGWLLLGGLQLAIALLLFHDFIFGSKFFAFFDIGSDTFFQFTPSLIYMASPANWSSAWSFSVGLGGLAPLPTSPFALLGIAAGPDGVLGMRIWVYLVKILLGGGAFYGFLHALGSRRDVAVICALSYSFCGFSLTDGQWDTMSTDFATYPLILWALAQHMRKPNHWAIPASIAFAVYCGSFFFSLGIFLIYAFLAALAGGTQPSRTLRVWLREILPLASLGFLLAAPVLVPLAYQLLDSPRVAGEQSLLARLLQNLLAVNDGQTLLVELAGFFQKNILGVGSRHYGWMNYLEGPGYFVGVLPLLLIPQLWRGERTDRRILLLGAAAIAAFLLFPALRTIAYGFTIDYFRVNNLWISLLLLILFARALELVLERGIGRPLLAAAVATWGIGLAAVESGLRAQMWVAHAGWILAALAVATLLLGLFAWQRLSPRVLVMGMLALVAAEAVFIGYPSFHERRDVVTTETRGYKDATIEALALIRQRDPGIYRVEKTFDSVSYCDALAQGYRGVKSYGFSNSSSIRLYSDLNLFPRQGLSRNYTNWLPGFHDRFVLYSLVGVRYMLARTTLPWPGFRRVGDVRGLAIHENLLALPLGVVYEEQFPRDRFLRLPVDAMDLTLANAVVVDSPLGAAPKTFAVERLSRPSENWIGDNYVEPIRKLQRRGLAIEHFDNGHIVGQVNTDAPGVLVFSIPYSTGWSVSVDGVRQDAVRAQLGFLATPVAAGQHRIELNYRLPGLLAGLSLGFAGLLGLGILNARTRRGTKSPEKT